VGRPPNAFGHRVTRWLSQSRREASKRGGGIMVQRPRGTDTPEFDGGGAEDWEQAGLGFSEASDVEGPGMCGPIGLCCFAFLAKRKSGWAICGPSLVGAFSGLFVLLPQLRSLYS